jgi:hypothetical protein
VIDQIDEVDRKLEGWAENVLGAGLASLAPPDPAASGRGVSLYLLDLVHRPPARGAPQPHLDLTLRYLVTAWSQKPAEAHRLLADLLFAAASNADFEVELGSPTLEMWTALDVPPRPAFVLRVALRKELAVRRAPLVRRPIAIEMAPAGPLTGFCLGPEEFPLTGALIEVPALNVSTRTDHDGRFAFSSVPRDATHLLVRATAKGKTITVDAGARAVGAEPLVIQFDMTEG